MRHELDAREYKLLLNPERFLEDTYQPVAVFWSELLTPLIDRKLGRRTSSEPRFEGKFGDPVERMVRFWDSEDCSLTKADLALRERRGIDSGDGSSARAEITLKLRMPDLFVVADADLPGSGDDADTDFEEDIAPLAIDDPGPGSRAIVVAPEPSIRSRFSLSTTQTAAWRDVDPTLGDLQSLYPTLTDLVVASGVLFEPTTALTAGPTIRELVFKGAKVRLGEEVVGKLALTLWCFEAAGAAPAVAEISFKCTIDDGEMAGKAARRALKLFNGMQSELGDWLNLKHSSKTALALPGACGRPID